MLEVGQIVGNRYKIESALGSGGMGTTYAAIHIESGQRVALKTLSMASLQDWKSLELFEREAQVLKTLDHPGIPDYIESLSLEDDDGNAFCLVQELVEGSSLAQRRTEGWRPGEKDIRQIADSVLETLIYLHDRNPPVIHRDIKPQNIILGSDNAVSLVDFGAVKDGLKREGSFASTVVGTYGYMAPEQFRGHAVPSSDLYGLGATIVFLATGRDPSELPQSRLKVDFRSASNLSPRFEQWLDGILEPAPEDRIDTAARALDALRRLDDRRDPPKDPNAPLPYLPPIEPQTRPSLRREPPKGSRIKVKRRGDSLTIDLPASGIKGLTAQTIFTLGFSIFWLSFVAVWTTLALMAGPMALFSIPFWLVGIWMVWNAVKSIGASQRIKLSRERVSIDFKALGQRYHKVWGHPRDIDDIRHHAQVNMRRGMNQQPTSEAVRIHIGVKHADIGQHLSTTELNWLVATLQNHLESQQQSRVTLPDFDDAVSNLADEAAEHEVVFAGKAGKKKKKKHKKKGKKS